MTDANQIKSANTELIFVFVTDEGSDLQTTQSQNIQARESHLQAAGINAFFAQESTVTELSDNLADKPNLDGSVVIFRKTGENLDYVENIPDISNSDNWAEMAETYSKNYKETEPDEDGLFKWGQVVQEDGEYLCVDCGYIINLVKGDILPICEVCLSGLPEGPSGPEKGFWEKI
jgi:hypothetical protein